MRHPNEVWVVRPEGLAPFSVRGTRNASRMIPRARPRDHTRIRLTHDLPFVQADLVDGCVCHGRAGDGPSASR